MKINTNSHDERAELFIDKKVALCRCWQSKKFPLCDGSHREWNQAHDDNVGPMIVSPSES